MPRVSYEDGQKEAIVRAALDSRKSGKTWTEAHEAAKGAGYQGSQQGIIKLIRALEKRKGKAVRRPGRPAGSKSVARKLTDSAPAVSVTSDIADLVNTLVKSRINATLDRAIRVLQDAKV